LAIGNHSYRKIVGNRISIESKNLLKSNIDQLEKLFIHIRYFDLWYQYFHSSKYRPIHISINCAVL